MSKPGIAVVDTSVIILIGAPSDDPETVARRARAHDRLLRFQKEGAVFAVAAPSIAELHRDGPGGETADRILGQFGDLRIDALDLEAAEYAGQSLRATLSSRGPGASRNAVKFDALIAGVAHRIGATHLLTADKRDFERHLGEMQSAIEVVVVSDPPEKGQLRLIDQGG